MKLLTVSELAELMRVSEGHIRNLMTNKKIVYHKIPGIGIRFLTTDVLAMIDQARVDARDWDEEARKVLDKSNSNEKQKRQQ